MAKITCGFNHLNIIDGKLASEGKNVRIKTIPIKEDHGSRVRSG